MFFRLWRRGRRLQAGRKKFPLCLVAKARFLKKVSFLVIVWWSFPLYPVFSPALADGFLGVMTFFNFFWCVFLIFRFCLLFFGFFWGVGGYPKNDRHQVVWWFFPFWESGCTNKGGADPGDQFLIRWDYVEHVLDCHGFFTMVWLVGTRDRSKLLRRPWDCIIRKSSPLTRDRS